MREIQDIHLPLIAWLNKEGIPFHRNRPDKKTTALRGDPDFLLTFCNRCLYLEAKTDTGKLSIHQKDRIAYLKSAGNRVDIVYSVEEAIAAVQIWLGIANAVPSSQSKPCWNPPPYPEEELPQVDPAKAPRIICESEKFRVGKWQGKEFVFAKDLDGGWQMIRQATPTDLLNFERLK